MTCFKSGGGGGGDGELAGAGPGAGARLQDLMAGRCVRYGSVVLHVEEEEKVDAKLETMTLAMVASAAEGVQVVCWRKCDEEEEEEGEEEEYVYEYEEESVDDEEFEPRPEFDPGGT